jgi:hypothetical protein
MSLFFVPTTTIAEKKRLWNEYTEKITTLPYYDEDRLLMFDVADDESGYHQDASHNLSSPLRSDTSAVLCPPRRQHFANIGTNKVATTANMRNNVKQAKVIDRISRNSMAIFLTFHALDQKCEEKKRQRHVVQQDSTTFPPSKRWTRRTFHAVPRICVESRG